LCQYDEENEEESEEDGEYPSEDQEEARDIRFRSAFYGVEEYCKFGFFK
jgi:hypothetical protein